MRFMACTTLRNGHPNTGTTSWRDCKRSRRQIPNRLFVSTQLLWAKMWHGQIRYMWKTSGSPKKAKQMDAGADLLVPAKKS